METSLPRVSSLVSRGPRWRSCFLLFAGDFVDVEMGWVGNLETGVIVAGRGAAGKEDGAEG